MLKFCARHGMIVDEVHEINFFKEVNCLEKKYNFEYSKKKLEANDFGKDFYLLFKNAFHRKKNKIYWKKCW